MTEPLVRLEGAALTYPGPPPVTALQPTSLEIQPGEYIAIVGASGSGKSTLLNLIGLLEPPSSGLVFVDGIDVAGLRSKEIADIRARTFGFVFQRFHLMPALTALANVEIALTYQGIRKPERRDTAHAALERVGLGARVGHLPAELSGGEQQRVAIARAIACGQSCLLADEPTGNLDSITSDAVLGLLDDIAQSGTSVLCVTHSPTVARHARRHLDVTDGVVRSTTVPVAP